MKTDDGRLIIISGASRSGKSAYALRAVRGEKRVMVWDIDDQWSREPGYTRMTSRSELLAWARVNRNGRVAYVSSGVKMSEDFEYFSEMALYAGRYIAPLVVVAEEVADVTSPAKANGWWGKLLRRGMKRGITIYVIAQRFSEADKTSLGNQSESVIFRCGSADDSRYIARKTRLPFDEVEALKPLDYIRCQSTGEKERGRLRF